MTKRTAQLYIIDILDSIKNIEEYIKGMDFEEFEKDQKTIDAVVRNFEIIGEASRNMPEDIKLKRKDIPWSKMIGMRNILAHEYFSADLEIIWETIQEDLLHIKLLIDDVLKKES